jgi:hypothetical protein
MCGIAVAVKVMWVANAKAATVVATVVATVAVTVAVAAMEAKRKRKPQRSILATIRFGEYNEALCPSRSPSCATSFLPMQQDVDGND